MTLRLSCHHGHKLEIQDDLTDSEIVCDRCGSVTAYNPSGDTSESRAAATIDSIPIDGPPLDATSDHIEAVDGSSPPGMGDDNVEGVHLTEDYEPPPTTGFSREAAVTGDASGSLRATGAGARGEISKEQEPPDLPGYQVIEELGRGGMGVVYRARDLANERDVALKTLQQMSPDGLQQFKGEFRALADIAHPNLASLYELLSDGQTWCFSMEILHGVDFLQYVWSGFDMLEPQASRSCAASSNGEPRLTDARLERLQDAMRQLAVGLSTLHNAGMLHSDIKPSNVLMTTEGRLVLLDFGLVVPIARKGKSKLIQGTPLYMSPEQSRAESMTAASDWYAVGVMLYELLTGRLPFRGKSIEVMKKKQLTVPVDAVQLQPSIPQHLNDICMALLERNPAKRPTASDVLRCFGAADDADAVAAPDQGSEARAVELVGREKHLKALRSAFAQVEAGDTLTALVHGRSGMGKSVLVRRFLDAVSSGNDAVVLEGRCYEQESVPFKALDSLIDSLAVFLSTFSADRVQSVMPRDRLALTRVFPVLGGLPEDEGANYPSIENADQQELRQRAMNALRELLQRLAIREPLVLYIDDLQWGDVDSAALLADLVRPPDAPRMLLLASYRSEDAQRSMCLRALDEAFKKGQNLPKQVEVAVEELAQEEATGLAMMLLSGDKQTNQELASKIAHESGGWPFFVWELVQHVRDDPNIANQTLELDEVIWSRVKRLPPDSIAMLELVAVAARPMPAAEVYQAVDAQAKGPSLLSQLRTNHFVRTTESEDEGTVVESYHDRIRESVFKHLEPEVVKTHNLNLAITIEKASGINVADVEAHLGRTPAFEEPSARFELDKHQWQRVFDVSFYFDVAGEYQRAFPYALLAAEQSRTQNALEVSEQQFRIATRGLDNVSSEMRFRVLEGLGDVLVLRGKYVEASEQFESARSLVEESPLLARLNWKLGVAWFKKGDMGEARDYNETAIKALGEHPPSVATVIPRALKEAVVQVLHTWLPSRFVGRKDPASEQGKLDLQRARIYDQLTFSYWFTRGMNFVLWSHLRQMNLAERYPPSPELGKTYAFHAVTMTGLPMAQRGIAYAEKAYEISCAGGDLWGQGKARSYHTFACIVLARFKEGVEKGSEAVELLERAGDVWESNMARMIATVPMYHLGDLETAYRESKKAYEIGLETGDYSAVCISLLFWIPTNPKTIPPGAIQTELDRQREDPLTIAGAVLARGLELLLCEDEPKQAAKVLNDSLIQAKRLGLRNVCLFSGVTWKATALRVVAEREPEGPGRQRAIREATSAVQAALKITKSYRAFRPQALRERGLVAMLEGKEELARKSLDEGLQLAEQHEARYDRAQTLRARGQAGVQFGWPDAAAEIEEAQAALDELEKFQSSDSDSD